ncbi:MAG: fumarylacetoacetate hydrolase family protein [Candidatus Hodarchaeales archaeon]|jgi:2-keto-4-pentenoate hydratase/2-oxohepta-3-ene-1,7-dioic acid hydratase in catechol pathway
MRVFSRNGTFFVVKDGEIIIKSTFQSLNDFYNDSQLFIDKNGQDGQHDIVDLVNYNKLAPPVSPSKIICVGRNYAEHAKELGNVVPEEPLLFLKPPSTLLGHGENVIYPDISQLLHHEAELGVVISKKGKNVPRKAVEDHIAGFTVGVDITARDLQRTDKTWLRGKGFDTFCPVGPVVVCNDELSLFEAQDAEIKLTVNGELRQKARTRDMIFKIEELVEYISTIMTLFPGDLILTGTPSGVGILNRGDEIKTTIEGIGTLENKVT